VKCLLEQLQHTYNELTDKNEINILEKYGNYAKRYTIVILCKKKLLLLYVRNLQLNKIIFKRSLVFSIFVAFSLSLHLFWPHLNILFFANGTQLRPLLPLKTEYFIDQEKYLYWILFHANVALIIGGIVLIATGTILLFYQQHACGMFRIAR